GGARRLRLPRTEGFDLVPGRVERLERALRQRQSELVLAFVVDDVPAAGALALHREAAVAGHVTARALTLQLAGVRDLLGVRNLHGCHVHASAAPATRMYPVRLRRR